MKKTPKKFSHKLFIAIIALIAVVMSALFAIFYYNLLRQKNSIKSLFGEMRNDINDISSVTLDDNYDTMMRYIVDDQVYALTYAMNSYGIDLHYLADVVEAAYRRNIRSQRPVTEPRLEDDGKLTVQLLYEENVDMNDEDVKYDIDILSTVRNELMLSVEDSIEMPRCYIETESGLLIIADRTTKDKFDENGNVKHLSFRNQERYLSATEDKMYVSDIAIDRLTGKRIIVLSMPYFDEQGKKRGVVCYEMFDENIKEQSLAIKKTDIYDTVIVDSKNNVVANSDESGVISDANLAAQAKYLRESERVKIDESDIAIYHDDEYVVYYKNLDFADWMLFVTLDKDVIRKDIDELIKVLDDANNKAYAEFKMGNSDFIKIVAIFSLLLLIFIFFFARYIANFLAVPLDSFSENINIVDADNLKPVAVDSSSKELWTLSTTYNHMIDKMKSYVDNIEEITIEKEKIKAELQVAKKIQQDMLPKSFDNISLRKDVEVYGVNVPEIEIGGDFYNYILIGNKLMLIIADVSGSGIPAGLFMAKVNALLNSAISWTTSPRTILSYVNSELYKKNTELYFVTISIYTIDLKTRHVVSVNAGHEDSIIINDKEVKIQKEKRSAPIGLLENIVVAENEFDLAEGDTLFLFTDGVVEAINRKEELFGVKRLLKVLDDNKMKPLKEMLSNVKLAISEYEEGLEQYDDVTMLTLRFKKRDNKYSDDFIYHYEKSFSGSYEIIDDIIKFISDKLAEVYKGNIQIYVSYMNKIEVCIEEIAANIIEYAYTDKDEKYIDIEFSIDRNEDKLSITFIDNGKQFDPRLVERPNILKDANDRKIGGLGVYLAREYMDVMDYEYIGGKNKLTLTKYL